MQRSLLPQFDTYELFQLQIVRSQTVLVTETNLRQQEAAGDKDVSVMVPLYTCPGSGTGYLAPGQCNASAKASHACFECV
jgi:hypothetical protein